MTEEESEKNVCISCGADFDTEEDLEEHKEEDEE